VDDTARREAQLRLQEQTRRMQEIVNSVPEGMLLLDAEGRILLANPVARSYLEFLGLGGVGDTLSGIGKRSLASLLTFPPDGSMWHEVRVDSRSFEVSARPLRGETSRERWVLMLRDVTRERAMQQHVQQQERLAAVGQLAAGVAHDFNNIMAVIVLYADMALRSDVPSKTKEQMRTIVQQGKRATDLIQQLLDFSRRGDFEQRPLDLVSFLKEQVKLLARTLPDNIEISFESKRTTCPIGGDPTRLQQAVMNLVVNARDAIIDGGHISLVLDCLEFNETKDAPLPEMQPGVWARLVVQDTGAGISSDILSHIFDPFFTTKQPGKGSGLGLAQVYGIVKQHGGEIAVDSQIDEGTTFTLYFPLIASEEVATVQEKPLSTSLSQGNREKILIVEDNLSTLQALIQSLEMLNYHVVAARDGVEALERLDQHPEIAVILSDLVMPRMGGIDLLDELSASGVNTPVVILSGHAEVGDLARLEAETSLFAWLPKPVNLEELAKVIAQALEKR
jgi:signal transduction histidine kinase/ActR/RegA family two-component response regulator